MKMAEKNEEVFPEEGCEPPPDYAGMARTKAARMTDPLMSTRIAQQAAGHTLPAMGPGDPGAWGEHGEGNGFFLRTVIRDGEEVWQLRCPGCEMWADVDEDQFYGRVSVEHVECGYHDTHDWSQELRRPRPFRLGK